MHPFETVVIISNPVICLPMGVRTCEVKSISGLFASVEGALVCLASSEEYDRDREAPEPSESDDL